MSHLDFLNVLQNSNSNTFRHEAAHNEIIVTEKILSWRRIHIFVLCFLITSVKTYAAADFKSKMYQKGRLKHTHPNKGNISNIHQYKLCFKIIYEFNLNL